MNKGIIVIGSSGSGKTTLIESLYKDINELEYYKWINIDHYVEDKDHKFYNNPLQASRFINDTIIPEIMQGGRDFIWDCTGANMKPIQKLIENNPNYDIRILIHYCEPGVCYLRNLKRERIVPKYVVINNWIEVYSQIQDYIKLVGIDNIYIHVSTYGDEESKFIEGNQVFNILNHSIINDTTSTFKKSDTEYTEKETIDRSNKWISLIHVLGENHTKLKRTINDLQGKELYKWILEIK